jgi:Pregnancy-associated plasma protein-A/Secretion system C-terminal sorting domain
MKFLLYTLLLAVYPCIVFSQEIQRVSKTNELMKKLRENNPDVMRRQQTFETLTDAYQAEDNAIESMRTIPVVFHILYHNHEERIDLSQIFNQIEALNRDFSLKNEFDEQTESSKTNRKLKSVPGLMICLPQFTPEGLETTGIIYHSTNRSSWSIDDKIKYSKSGGADAWDTRHYLNIWVANLEEGNAGYAQMPGGPVNTDGIVIDYRMFGLGGKRASAYNEGKTLTHLVGNYLNLYPIWGDGSIECADDHVGDTPLHNAPNFEILSENHISLCPSYPLEMFNNFMDFTHDSLRNMFTAGQCRRINATLSKGGMRSELLTTPTQCGMEVFAERNTNQWLQTDDLQIRAFPNPASEQLFIQSSSSHSEEIRLDVFNATGRSMIFKDCINKDTVLPCANWPNGLYYLIFSIDGKTIQSQRVTILH